MTMIAYYDFSLTTQGPTYPPSEVMNKDGHFIVIGRINRVGENDRVTSDWGRAIVSTHSPIPKFGDDLAYDVIRELAERLISEDEAMVLYTLPLPLPCNNYPMVFAPEQFPNANKIIRPSYAFHEVPIPDLRKEDGRKITKPITLGDWSKAGGQLKVEVSQHARRATFRIECTGLIPNSMYTVMSLRQHDLDPLNPTRPGPLGIPNVFISDKQGNAKYSTTQDNPFPSATKDGANRIINVIILWMSYQMNCGGAIGQFGLGGDIHAQLKLKVPSFFQFETRE